MKCFRTFLGDFTRWVVERFESKGPSDELLRNIFQFVENAYVEGGEHLQELIAVSFLENLPGSDERGAELSELLGLQLAKQFSRLQH